MSNSGSSSPDGVNPAIRERVEEAERFIAAAREIIAEAQSRDILLRLLGSLAFRVHSPENAYLLDEMQRVLTDLDFASERKYATGITTMFAGLGYAQDQDISTATGGARYYFKHPRTGLGVDIFMEELHYCHPIPFKGRLHVDDPTIPLAELLLEKMQIVELNEKDVKDTIVLFLGHDVGPSDDETINVDYIARMLGQDWGFYYTVMLNLQRVEDHLRDYGALRAEDRAVVQERVEKTKNRIEREPKSMRWKARAKIGTRKQWYQQVEAKNP